MDLKALVCLGAGMLIGANLGIIIAALFRANDEPTESPVIRVKLDKGAFLPERAHESDAGLDLMSPVRVVLRPKTREKINTGVHVEIPTGYVGMLKSKSGLMTWNGLTSEGTIDAGYTGEIGVVLFNHSDEMMIIERGHKISQLVVLPIITPKVVPVDEIEGGERGSDGFGSTGR